MKLTRGLWVSGRFRRRLLREILSAKKAGQNQNLRVLQESVRRLGNSTAIYMHSDKRNTCTQAYNLQTPQAVNYAQPECAVVLTLMVGL